MSSGSQARIDQVIPRQYNAPMKSLRYTVILEHEQDGGYHAFVPALKGCHSQGDTVEEAMANIREAIEVYLESMKDMGESAPIEDIVVTPIEIAA